MNGSIALVALLMLVGAATPAPAAGVQTFKSEAEMYRAVLDRIERLERTGAPRKTIDRTLERVFGWFREPALAGPIALGTASASDVTLFRPTLYRNIPLNRYEVTAKWQWKDCGASRCWMLNYPGISGSVGGPNGFALNSSRNVNFLATTFATYDEDGGARHYSNPEVFEADGVGFTEQDRQHWAPWDDFTWDHGTLVFAFRLAAPCRPGQLWKFTSKMGHTWQSTSISSLTISPTNISMTFSSVEARWTATSPTPLDWKPCG